MNTGIIIGEAGNGTMTASLILIFRETGGDGNRTNVGTSQGTDRPDTRKAEILDGEKKDGKTDGMTEWVSGEKSEEIREKTKEKTDGMIEAVVEGRTSSLSNNV